MDRHENHQHEMTLRVPEVESTFLVIHYIFSFFNYLLFCFSFFHYGGGGDGNMNLMDDIVPKIIHVCSFKLTTSKCII